jgi:hypothetical protein
MPFTPPISRPTLPRAADAAHNAEHGAPAAAPVAAASAARPESATGLSARGTAPPAAGAAQRPRQASESSLPEQSRRLYEQRVARLAPPAADNAQRLRQASESSLLAQSRRLYEQRVARLAPPAADNAQRPRQASESSLLAQSRWLHEQRVAQMRAEAQEARADMPPVEPTGVEGAGAELQVRQARLRPPMNQVSEIEDLLERQVQHAMLGGRIRRRENETEGEANLAPANPRPRAPQTAMSAAQRAAQAAVQQFEGQEQNIARLEPGPAGEARVATIRRNLEARGLAEVPAGQATQAMQNTRLNLTTDAQELIDAQIGPIEPEGGRICDVTNRLGMFLYNAEKDLPLPADHPLGDDLPQNLVADYANQLLALGGFEHRVTAE